MLASEHKLIGIKAIEAVKNNGIMFQRQDFGVSVVKRKDNKPSRFGFVVSNKISKLAVHRNRIKRAMREAVRRNIKGIDKNYDMLFLTKKSMANKTTEQIMVQVVNFLEKKEFEK